MRYLPSLCLLFGAAISACGQPYSISTVAGSDRVRDGGTALQSLLRSPSAVVADSAGNLYIADAPDGRIRKVNTAGVITTYGGIGLPAYGGDNGPAVQAGFANAIGLALDAQGNLYVADRDANRVRKIAAGTGVVTTVAGNGGYVYSGDGGPATSAALDPRAIALDSAGNLYIADAYNFRLRKVTPNGIISTIAGNGQPGPSGDNGPATAARLGYPSGVTVDAAGNVYVADYDANLIRRIAAGTGVITTIAGNGNFQYSGDGGPASAAGFDPYAISVDAGGNLYIADNYNNRVRKIAGGVISTVAGNGNVGFSGDGGTALSATLTFPSFTSVDAAGNIYVADSGNYRVRRIATGGTISTVAGTSVADGGAATGSFLNLPLGIAADASGNFFVADTANNRVRQVNTAGLITTVAGTGVPGWTSDGASAPRAYISAPGSVALDSAGNLYFADSGNYLIRKVASGVLSTVAGTRRRGFSGDGGQATSAQLGVVTGLAVDAQGNIYFADSTNKRVRKVSVGGTINTIAGNGSDGALGDNGPATNAQVSPYGLAVDRSGNVYIAERANNRIRKIDPSGTIFTIAGTGAAGYSGDGGPAIRAQLSGPTGVALDDRGNLYIADYENSRVRVVNLSTGIITTVAGTGRISYGGDGVLATLANLNPFGLAIDSRGGILVADSLNDRVRRLTPITAARIALASGNNQSGVVGVALANPLTVQVVDASGVGVPGVSVSFTATTGAATCNPATAVTAVDGTATTRVTLGAAAGQIVITASAAGLTPVTFTLAATAGSGGNPAAASPRISSGGIVGAGLSTPPVKALAPNSIASIFGENFAPAGTLRFVTGADLVNSFLPTNLGGICVEVGGVRAPIFTVTPTQINFQVPAVPGAGAAPVQVVGGCGTASEVKSNAEVAVMQSSAPEFFYFRQNTDGRNPIAAINATSGANIGSPGLLPGATFTPARSGDVLTLFLTGVGATTPSFQAGELPASAAQAAGDSSVSINGIPIARANLLYVGVSPGNAGLYQINLRVPEGLAGDLPVVVTINGISSSSTAYLTFQ